jgi:hypothetical protein
MTTVLAHSEFVLLRHHELGFRRRQKNEQGQNPARKIVSTRYPQMIRFMVAEWGDAACCAPGLLPRLGPPDEMPRGLSRFSLVPDLFWFVINFWNKNSNSQVREEFSIFERFELRFRAAMAGDAAESTRRSPASP